MLLVGNRLGVPLGVRLTLAFGRVPRSVTLSAPFPSIRASCTNFAELVLRFGLGEGPEVRWRMVGRRVGLLVELDIV